MRSWSLLILVVLLLMSSGRAQTNSGKRLQADVQFLADDLLLGRRTPSPGLDIAALYLANQLEAYGWQPAFESGYLQTFDIETFAPLEGKYRIAINGIELSPDEYIFWPVGMDVRKSPFEYELVFLGQGIFDPEKKIDDFKGIDVKGQAGVALYGAPWPLDLHAIHSCDRAIGKCASFCLHGGSLLVYVTEELNASAGREIGAEIPVLEEISQTPTAIIADAPEFKTVALSPMLLISPQVFDKCLAQPSGHDYLGWQKRLNDKKRVASFPLSAKITIEIQGTMVRQKTQNVVAVKRGTDPQLAQEWLALSAHYDHVGATARPDGSDGIFNGADDNASGTAAILETARQLSQDSNLRRSVVVLFCCGEENGLLGSAYFTSHSPVPLEKIILNVNADMVGRSSGSLNCINSGCDELYLRTRQIGESMGFTVKPDPYPSWRLGYFIDSFSFSRHNIPFIQYMTDFHADYHQPSDEAKLINYQSLEQITRIIRQTVQYYAQGDERPVFRRPAWFLTF